MTIERFNRKKSNSCVITLLLDENVSYRVLKIIRARFA